MDRPKCVVGVIRGVVGRAASGGVPQPPRATLSQSEPIQIFPENLFFPENFRVEPALTVLKKTFPPKNFGEPACSDFPISFKTHFFHFFPVDLSLIFPQPTFFPTQSDLDAAAASGRVGEVPKKVN
jgi:hypothetical protein